MSGELEPGIHFLTARMWRDTKRASFEANLSPLVIHDCHNQVVVRFRMPAMANPKSKNFSLDTTCEPIHSG